MPMADFYSATVTIQSMTLELVCFHRNSNWYLYSNSGVYTNAVSPTAPSKFQHLNMITGSICV